MTDITVPETPAPASARRPDTKPVQAIIDRPAPKALIIFTGIVGFLVFVELVVAIVVVSL